MAGEELTSTALGGLVDLLADQVNPGAQPSTVFEHFSIPAYDEGRRPQRELGSAIKSNKFRVPEGALLLSKLNPRINRVWDARPTDGIQAVASTEFLVLKVRKGTDRRFLHYLLSAPDFRDALASRVTGTSGSHQRVRPTDVLDIEVAVPDLHTQAAIASILGALDDKIELNRRMSETLEEMARALFKAWFVDFEPTRALVELTAYPLPADLLDLFPREFHDGLPLGWRLRPAGEVMQNFDRMRVPLSFAQRSSRRGRFRYYGAAGVIDHVDDYLFDGTYVLVGEDGSVVRADGTAVVQYVWGKFWVNNHAHVVQGRGPVSTEHVYLYFLFERVTPYVTGAVQAKLAQSRMNRMPFVDPGEAILTAFGDLVSPYFARLRSLSDEASTLSDLRDTLLPKLVSGELRVPEAERLVSEVA